MENEVERELRLTLATLVHTAGIFGLREEGLEREFLEGKVDVQLSALGMDSLSAMELCIGIEQELGVSIVPTELTQLKTLGDLVGRIKKLQAG